MSNLFRTVYWESGSTGFSLYLVHPTKPSVGGLFFGIARNGARFGYHVRWRWLAPISTRVKLVRFRPDE